MTVPEICSLQVEQYAAVGCHLWLWVTNQFLRHGFEVMEAWGFKYMAPIHWIKPSGVGNWWVHRSETMLFGYYQKCVFPQEKYLPNIFEASRPRKHSLKPEASYELIERVSAGPRLELFARPWSDLFPVRPGWDVWGNEVESDNIHLLA
jgi:N6-adenosine-specific RNA methylase IME4